MADPRPPQKPETKEGLPRVSVYHNRDVQSVLELDEATLDPTFHYRWVRDDPMRIARHKMRGFKPVSMEENVKTLAEVTDDAGDGIIRIGDVILMKAPREMNDERRKAIRQFSEARLGTPKKQFKKGAKKRQIKIIEEED